MSKYKLRKAKHFGFKNKTKGGDKVLISRNDRPHNRFTITGAVFKKDGSVIGASWTPNGSSFDERLASIHDLIPLKNGVKPKKKRRN